MDDSRIARSDLLRAEIYPDSDDVGATGVPPVLSNGHDGVYDRIEYTYNRQGQRLSMKDQNGSIHQYEFDTLGRPLHDRITTLALDVDGAVRRISTTYDIRGNVEQATSYDNAAVGSGNVVNEVVREYNDFGLLDREYQEHSGAKDGNTPYVGYNYDESALNGELENGLRPVSLRYPNGRLVHYTYGSTDSASDVLNRFNAINVSAQQNHRRRRGYHEDFRFPRRGVYRWVGWRVSRRSRSGRSDWRVMRRRTKRWRGSVIVRVCRCRRSLRGSRNGDPRWNQEWVRHRDFCRFRLRRPHRARPGGKRWFAWDATFGLNWAFARRFKPTRRTAACSSSSTSVATA